MPQANKTARQALKEKTQMDAHSHIHTNIYKPPINYNLAVPLDFVKHPLIISEQNNIVSALYSRKYNHMGVGTKRCDYLSTETQPV